MTRQTQHEPATLVTFQNYTKAKNNGKEKKRERNWAKIPKYKCVFIFRGMGEYKSRVQSKFCKS